MKLLGAGAEAMYADLGHFSPKSIKVNILPMYIQCKSSNTDKITYPSELSVDPSLENGQVANDQGFSD